VTITALDSTKNGSSNTGTRAKGNVAVSSEQKQKDLMFCYATEAGEQPAERWRQWDLKNPPNSQILRMEHGENFLKILGNLESSLNREDT